MFVFCAIWCLVWSVDDLVEKKPLKSSKKSHAIEGAVRLIGSDNSNEGEIVECCDFCPLGFIIL